MRPLRGLTGSRCCRMLQILTAIPEENVKVLLHPWQLLLLVLAGWVNRRQQDVIEYLLVENRVLRQKLGKRRILLNEEQRRRLAVKGKILGRKMLEQVAGIVTPETILRWHRELVARHWDYSQRRQSAGRPPIAQEIVNSFCKLAKENPTLGLQAHPGRSRESRKRDFGYGSRKHSEGPCDRPGPGSKETGQLEGIPQHTLGYACLG